MTAPAELRPIRARFCTCSETRNGPASRTSTRRFELRNIFCIEGNAAVVHCLVPCAAHVPAQNVQRERRVLNFRGGGCFLEPVQHPRSSRSLHTYRSAELLAFPTSQFHRRKIHPASTRTYWRWVRARLERRQSDAPASYSSVRRLSLGDHRAAARRDRRGDDYSGPSCDVGRQPHSIHVACLGAFLCIEALLILVSNSKQKTTGIPRLVLHASSHKRAAWVSRLPQER